MEITTVLMTGVFFVCVLFLALYLDRGKTRGAVSKFKNFARRTSVLFAVIRAGNKLLRKVFSNEHFFQESKFRDEKVHIAFYPTGGLGDYIISAKILEELMAIAPCKMHVFTEKMAFGQAVYGNRENVDVLPYDKFQPWMFRFDLVLMVEHFVHVEFMDAFRVATLSPELYHRMRYIQIHWDTLYVNIAEQWWRERVQFERCRALGLDRWTELRMGHAFAVKDKNVYIPLLDDAKVTLSKYGLETSRYVTLNYGADHMQAGKQLKLWEAGHFAALLKMVKHRYPQIRIVQLGGRTAEKIDGADAYVFGESIELTKWILKGSLLHIDGEGGLVHLATQFGTTCIVLFGPTPVHMYGYPQNINLVSAECQNCMGLHADWAYACYRTHKRDATPPCMMDISAEKVFHHVTDVLDRKGEVRHE